MEYIHDMCIWHWPLADRGPLVQIHPAVGSPFWGHGASDPEKLWTSGASEGLVLICFEPIYIANPIENHINVISAWSLTNLYETSTPIWKLSPSPGIFQWVLHRWWLGGEAPESFESQTWQVIKGSRLKMFHNSNVYDYFRPVNRYTMCAEVKPRFTFMNRLDDGESIKENEAWKTNHVDICRIISSCSGGRSGELKFPLGILCNLRWPDSQQCGDEGVLRAFCFGIHI